MEQIISSQIEKIHRQSKLDKRKIQSILSKSRTKLNEINESKKSSKEKLSKYRSWKLFIHIKLYYNYHNRFFKCYF